MNGTPCPKAFGRLQTGPRDRSPAAYNTSRSSKIRVDGFCTFHVKDSREHAILYALADFADVATEANTALRLRFDPNQQRDHAKSDSLG
jgi:hypothetical protein